MAGLVVTGTNVNTATNKPEPMTIYVDSDRMKMETGDNIMIYRGDLKTMWMINPADRTYAEMNPQAVQQMNGQLEQLRAQAQARLAQMSPQQRAQMEAGLAQLPPEQRARMEAMMAGRAAGPAPAPPQDRVAYVRAGGGKTVAGYHCDLYSKMVNNKKEEDVCVAPIASVGIVPGDFKVLESISSMMGPLTRQAGRQSDYLGLNEMNQSLGFQGIPLDTVDYSDDGRPRDHHTITKISRTAIPSNTYELPPGLTKKAMFDRGQP